MCSCCKPHLIPPICFVFFSFKKKKEKDCPVYCIYEDFPFKDSLAALTIAVRIFGVFFADLASTVHDEHTTAMQYGRGGLLQSGRYAGLFTLKVMSTVRGRSIGIRDA